MLLSKIDSNPRALSEALKLRQVASLTCPQAFPRLFPDVPVFAHEFRIFRQISHLSVPTFLCMAANTKSF